jgi:hypothetical protein
MIQGIGIGIGINRQRFGSGGTPTSFSTTEWQLLNTINWENITDTWN